MDQPLVSIVIVHYKCTAYTLACLKTIQDHAGTLTYEVIVVDNASADGIGSALSQEFPEVRFVGSGVNLGFAGANNLGVQLAQGRYILFLNPDTEVRENALTELIDALASDPRIGVAGARLLNSDGTVQTTSITALPSIPNQVLGAEWLRKTFPRLPLWGIAPLYSNSTAITNVDAVSGACMLMPREAVHAVSGFSSEYFMYSEDLDLCMRAKEAGWKVCHVPGAVVVHHGGGSSQTRQQSNYAVVMMKESLFHFFCKHRGLRYGQAFRISLFGISVLRLGAMLIASPLCLAPAVRASFLQSWDRWLAVLQWSCGKQRWVRLETRRAGYEVTGYQRPA